MATANEKYLDYIEFSKKIKQLSKEDQNALLPHLQFLEAQWRKALTEEEKNKEEKQPPDYLPD